VLGRQSSSRSDPDGTSFTYWRKSSLQRRWFWQEQSVHRRFLIAFKLPTWTSVCREQESLRFHLWRHSFAGRWIGDEGPLTPHASRRAVRRSAPPGKCKGYRDAVPVPTFSPRMVRTACEHIIGADARPNWREWPPRLGRRTRNRFGG
jgi:hypothetical protein